jgi:hypothetical protein
MTTKTHGITGELILYTTMHSGQAGCCDLTVGSSVSSLQCWKKTWLYLVATLSISSHLFQISIVDHEIEKETTVANYAATNKSMSLKKIMKK